MRLFFLILSLFASSSAFSAMNLLEKNIYDQVNKTKDAQIHLLKKLVTINSGTNNLSGVHRVGLLVQTELQQLGFKTHWEKMPANLHRAGTLVAEHSGKKGKHILLIAHLDTVSSANQSAAFILKQHTAKGPGVMDDKGGIVVMLYALKALKATHQLENKNITVVLTGDEEDSGKPTTLSRAPLRRTAIHHDIALDFEPSISMNTATIARRGVVNWRIISHGNESHSAAIFKENVGAGAIFALTNILNSMRITFQNESELSFNPGIIAGGTIVQENNNAAEMTVFGKHNVVAKLAIAKGDFRFVDETQKENIKKQMLKIVNTRLPYTNSVVTFEEGIPAMPQTKNNQALLEIYSQVSLDLNGTKIVALPRTLRGAGDIAYVANIVPANLSGLGPVGFGAHSVDETIELKTLLIQTERAALLINRLLQ